MAAKNGVIIIDWRQAMPPDTPAAELEVVGSSSPSIRPRPPAAAHVDADSDHGGGTAEFANTTDRKLHELISQWEGIGGHDILRKTRDGGEKMQARVSRAKEELERRMARQRKDDMAWRSAVQAKCNGGSTGGVYDFNPDDDTMDSLASKSYKNSSCTPSTKTYTQVKGAAYNERSSLSHVKCAYPKNVGRIAKDSASQLKTCAHLPKSTDSERLSMDGDRRKTSTLSSCTINQQKDNTVDNGTNATFVSNRRWNLAKNKASPSLKTKKDLVFLDDDDDDADDDTEPARSADVEIPNKWDDDSKIYYPSRTGPEAVVTYSDMKCLEPEEYLNSPVIDFYLQFLVTQFPSGIIGSLKLLDKLMKPNNRDAMWKAFVLINDTYILHPDYGHVRYLKRSRPRRDIYMFNTYFYSKLEEALSTLGDHDSEFSKLRRWWRSVDIFKKAYIILPINESKHWSLIIVCMPTKEADSGPIMLHLDSLGFHSSQKLFNIVERYLEAEWRHLQKDSFYDIPFSGRIWKRLPRYINGEKVEVPRQRNDYDCGLFMLHYIDRFIQDAPERLTKEGLDMFGRKWFNHQAASGLREGIRALLFDLFQSALEDDGP